MRVCYTSSTVSTGIRKEDDMARITQARRPNGSEQIPPRSIRIPDETWEPGKRRAKQEGYTISHVIALFVEGYASGHLDAPQTKTIYAKK